MHSTDPLSSSLYTRSAATNTDSYSFLLHTLRTRKYYSFPLARETTAQMGAPCVTHMYVRVPYFTMWRNPRLLPIPRYLSSLPAKENKNFNHFPSSFFDWSHFSFHSRIRQSFTKTNNNIREFEKNLQIAVSYYTCLFVIHVCIMYRSQPVPCCLQWLFILLSFAWFDFMFECLLLYPPWRRQVFRPLLRLQQCPMHNY